LNNILYAKHVVFDSLSSPGIQLAIGAIIIVLLQINITICLHSPEPKWLLLGLQINDHLVKELIQVHVVCMEFCVIQLELRILIVANDLCSQNSSSAE
jgi:hypothetical protein